MTRQELIALTNQLIVDNNEGLISPKDVRDVFTAIINSADLGMTDLGTVDNSTSELPNITPNSVVTLTSTYYRTVYFSQNDFKDGDKFVIISPAGFNPEFSNGQGITTVYKSVYQSVPGSSGGSGGSGGSSGGDPEGLYVYIATWYAGSLYVDRYWYNSYTV